MMIEEDKDTPMASDEGRYIPLSTVQMPMTIGSGSSDTSSTSSGDEGKSFIIV